MKRLLPLTVVLLLLVPVSGGGAATSRTVTIKDIEFRPGALSVPKGTTVRWEFRDGTTSHNVVSRGSKRFAGSAVKSRGSHRVTFRRTGTYRYVCTLHPGMDGRVTVR